MKTYVLDASVILKWIFKTDDEEDDIDKALGLLNLIELGQFKVLQPVHWLAEVMAVVCQRVESKKSLDILNLFIAMQLPVNQGIEIYSTAAQLAVKYNHHLFDTLYHATALESGNSVFITADAKYYKKVKQEGSIMLLSDYS